MPMTKHTCAYCGASFMAWPYKNRITCSRRCGTLNHIRETGRPSHNWKGGVAVPGSHGRPIINMTVDGKARMVYESVRKAELALGRTLPSGAIVHHADGDNTNNSNSNLVICQNQKYHLLLHARMRIFTAGGVPHQHKICSHCQILKTIDSFPRRRGTWDGRYVWCRGCCSQKGKESWERKKRASR